MKILWHLLFPCSLHVFIDIHLHVVGFTSGMKFQSIAYLPRQMNISIKLWTFKVNFTRCGICGQPTFKNARTIFLGNQARAGSSYWSRFKNKIKIGGTTRGCEIAGPWPSPPHLNDGVMAWPPRAHPNGTISSPKLTLRFNLLISKLSDTSITQRISYWSKFLALIYLHTMTTTLVIWHF